MERHNARFARLRMRRLFQIYMYTKTVLFVAGVGVLKLKRADRASLQRWCNPTSLYVFRPHTRNNFRCCRDMRPEVRPRDETGLRGTEAVDKLPNLARGSLCRIRDFQASTSVDFAVGLPQVQLLDVLVMVEGRLAALIWP